MNNKKRKETRIMKTLKKEAQSLGWQSHFGFTLAEVLITLGVIGIVAAMTIPNLVNSYHEKQRITQLKKAYSVLNQAFTMAVADYGTPENWGLTITNTGKRDEEGNAIYDRTGVKNIDKTLSKYIKSQPLEMGTIISDATYFLNGSMLTTVSSPWKVDDDNRYYRMSDGTIFYTGWVSNLNCEPYCADFWVFLPSGGKSKTLGVDAFGFDLTKKGIMPRGDTANRTGYTFYNSCSKSKPKEIAAANGKNCTAWVIYNGNMDYLHCDDLSWDGKHKCSD